MFIAPSSLSFLLFSPPLTAQHRIEAKRVSEGAHMYTYAQTMCVWVALCGVLKHQKWFCISSVSVFAQLSVFPHFPVVPLCVAGLLSDWMPCSLWSCFQFHFHSSMFSLQEVNGTIPSLWVFFFFSHLDTEK